MYYYEDHEQISERVKSVGDRCDEIALHIAPADHEAVSAVLKKGIEAMWRDLLYFGHVSEGAADDIFEVASIAWLSLMAAAAETAPWRPAG